MLANNPRASSMMLRIAFVLFSISCSFFRAYADPPNIVYIISDDQAWMDFGFMGNERVHTPNLDSLAQQSARFVNGYVPSSVCRPSLATLLTGLYPHQHGIHFNHGPPGNAGYNRMRLREEYESIREREFALIRSQITLPEALRRARGYRALQTGKFWEGHYRNGGFTDGMTTFEPPPIEQTFGGARTLAGGQLVAHGNGDCGLQIGRRTMQPIFDFIDDCESSDTPWMVWYAPFLPHQPHDSPQRFYELARQRPGVRPHELPYFASIAEFDETVGRLMRHVEDAGLSKETVYVFVCDNGWRPSESRERRRPQEFAHTRRSKRAPFDDGLRTPILLCWEDVVEPATHEGLVSSIDLMPTLLAVAGVDTDDGEIDLPGINLLPVARGESKLKPSRAIYGEIYPGDASSLGHPERDLAYRWIRQGPLKLIVPHTQSGSSRPWGDFLESVSLFDVTQDPFEKNNLAAASSQQSNLARLQEQLDAWWDGK